MTETFEAWQCIGCGRIEGPAQCIGVCQDHKVELVNALDYHVAVARAEALEEVVSLIAHTNPRSGAWEQTWIALQKKARKALEAAAKPPAGAVGSHGPAHGARAS